MGQPDNCFHGISMARTRRTVQRRVQRPVHDREEGAVLVAELGDQAAMALPGGDVQNRVLLSGDLLNSTSSMTISV